MPTKEQNAKNPGVPTGSEVIGLSSPFGGWVHSPTGNGTASHLAASVEGVEGGLEKPAPSNYAESDGITLFRLEKFGHIAPGHIFSKVTDTNTNVTDLPLNGVTNATGLSFAVLKNGRLISTTTAMGSVSGHYDPIPGGSRSLASTIYGDCLTLYDLASTPVQYILWSWEDSAGGDITAVLSNLSGSISSDLWYSTIATASGGSIKQLKKGVPHKMCIGPDGNLYITNGNYIEQVVINGALGDAANTKGGLELNIGSGWTATGIVSYKNYVAIIASNNAMSFHGETRVFLWTGISSTVNGVTSTAPQFIFTIPDNQSNGLFFDGNIMYSLTTGRNNTSKIWEFTGKGFKKVFESGLISYPNMTHGNLENFQDSFMIGGSRNSQGCLFRFYGGGFHNEGAITDGTNIALDCGMVKNLVNNLLTIGVHYVIGGVDKYALYTQSNLSLYQPGATLKTILYTSGILGRRMYPLGFKGTVNRIQLFLSQWGAGASLTLNLYKDYTTTDLLASKVLDTTTYPVGTTEIDISDFAIANVSSFYITITFSHVNTTDTAAIIRRMVIFWSPSQ